jgi:hypothetical protein
LNSTDVALIKNLPSSVNSTRHCIGPDCMISTDLVNLKNLSSLVNSSSLCSGSTCLNAGDVAYLKAWVENATAISVQAQPAPQIVDLTSNSIVSTYAGTGQSGTTNGNLSVATFQRPIGITVSQDNTIYIADVFSHSIRKISPDGIVSLLAGSGSNSFADGVGSAASFREPRGVAVGPNGNVYVADYFNHRIRVITPQGVVSTLAGSSAGFANGNGTSAQSTDMADNFVKWDSVRRR